MTPLIALMKDQIDRLRSRRILAESIHSGMSPRDIDRILDNCVYGSVKFLYIAPERIDSELFRTRFGKMRVSLLAVDEAHCISQWGYDFRPSYLRIARLRELQPDVPVLALTASATSEVAEDIMRHLKFREPHVRRMSFERANLSYVVRRTEDKHGQLLRIAESVPDRASSTSARGEGRNARGFSERARHSGGFYHGGMNYLMRSVRQDEWIGGTTRVMVATNAFGMGIDKADVRFVVHYDVCESLEAYYQEAGRAGRDGKPAYAVTLLSDDDASKAGRRMELDFPSKQTIRRVYEALFNYLGVAVGDGRGASFTFNVFDFAARFRFFVPTALQSIKILQQNGYMVLTDETDNPPRIRFIVQRDELYRIRVDRRELDHFITVLLRRYSGLFSDFVPIAEDELAHLTGYTTGRVRELLKKLWQLHIVKYVPGNRSPMLILSEERLPADDVRISPESYTLRKRQPKRLGAMLRYLNGDECRSIAIRRYFGEREPSPAASATDAGSDAKAASARGKTLSSTGFWNSSKTGRPMSRRWSRASEAMPRPFSTR
ncbi:MAG: RecQ family ATP-dependent DNA helicase [Alistipes sp.]